MRFTNVVYKNKSDYELCEAINIFSINIASSDVGFPIRVYGTVIARDSLDKKCVYLSVVIEITHNSSTLRYMHRRMRFFSFAYIIKY